MAHVMTPARRAALRKAQLASAAKRRRGGVGSAARRAVGQKAGYARASASVATRRHVGSKGFQRKVKKGVKYTAIGLGAAAAIGAGYGGTAGGFAAHKTYKTYRSHNFNKKMATKQAAKRGVQAVGLSYKYKAQDIRSRRKR
jgi:hypothetical protein